MPESLKTDVLVIGAGNAAFAAAHAAREHGADVLMLECAPPEESGGNTRFTAGAMRFAYRGVEDLVALMPDLTEDELARTDFGSYPEDSFFDDITDYDHNTDLTAEILYDPTSQITITLLTLYTNDSWLFKEVNSGSKEGDQAKVDTLGPFARAFG